MISTAIASLAYGRTAMFRDSAPNRFPRPNLPRLLLSAALILLCYSGIPESYAQDLDARIAGPFYHEESNSYYAHYEFPRSQHKYNWNYVRLAALQKTYKNVRGQLAIVDNISVHRFLAEKFNLKGPTWFGLRYFCGPKKLVWVDGRIQKPGEFAPWHSRWAGNPKITCLTQDMEYMGAYYIGEGSFLWQVQGEKKAYRSYLVQYKMPD